MKRIHTCYVCRLTLSTFGLLAKNDLEVFSIQAIHEPSRIASSQRAFKGLVKGSDFSLISSANLGESKSFGKQHDFADLLKIRHDADDWPEKRLDTFRQLRPSGISGIHRDDDPNATVQNDLVTFELSHVM